MSKLLSANFARLKKDQVFWGLMVGMFAFGIMRGCVAICNFVKYEEQMQFDLLFFTYTVVIGMLTAVYGSLFLGIEHSEGGIRNKLIVGHKRSSIYAANYITLLYASMLMCLSYIVPVSIIGIPMFGFFETKMLAVGILLLGSLLMIVAFCSVITLICMIHTNKAFGVAISILIVVVLFLLAMYINGRLAAPEYMDGIIITDNLGNMQTEMLPNSKYLRETARVIYQFFYDFLPTGQAMQYCQLSVIHPWQMLLYSLLITVVTTWIGVVVFQRKDIK